jgi:hypothetical protein
MRTKGSMDIGRADPSSPTWPNERVLELAEQMAIRSALCVIPYEGKNLAAWIERTGAKPLALGFDAHTNRPRTGGRSRAATRGFVRRTQRFPGRRRERGRDPPFPPHSADAKRALAQRLEDYLRTKGRWMRTA